MDRKAELERKKAKLQALRYEKDRRRKEKELKDLEEASGKVGTTEFSTKKYVVEVFLHTIGVYISINVLFLPLATACLCFFPDQGSRWNAFIPGRSSGIGGTVVTVLCQLQHIRLFRQDHPWY